MNKRHNLAAIFNNRCKKTYQFKTQCISAT